MTKQHNRLAGSTPQGSHHLTTLDTDQTCAPELFRAWEQEHNYHQYVRAANKKSAHNPFFQQHQTIAKERWSRLRVCVCASPSTHIKQRASSEREGNRN